MGMVMEPNNPLYKTVQPDLATTFSSTSKNLIASDFDKTEVLTANSLDFSLDEHASSQVDDLRTDNAGGGIEANPEQQHRPPPIPIR